jgi:hypothetical protein
MIAGNLKIKLAGNRIDGAGDSRYVDFRVREAGWLVSLDSAIDPARFAADRKVDAGGAESDLGRRADGLELIGFHPGWDGAALKTGRDGGKVGLTLIADGDVAALAIKIHVNLPRVAQGDILWPFRAMHIDCDREGGVIRDEFEAEDYYEQEDDDGTAKHEVAAKLFPGIAGVGLEDAEKESGDCEAEGKQDDVVKFAGEAEGGKRVAFPDQQE